MFAIVINKDGYKTEFVALNEDRTAQFYELKEDEQLIAKDWRIANSMNKPKWNFNALEWEETEPKDDEQIDICPPKTLEERLEEAEQKLAKKDQENKMLKAQVEANASSYEFLESCMMEMAEKVYA